MGHVTDGGLEPEPVASIKGPQPGVNVLLARFGANFSVILGKFWDEGRRQGAGWRDMVIRRGQAPGQPGRLRAG